jgi:hypothetical protein
VETGGGEIPWVLQTPFESTNDTGKIEMLSSAESGEVEMGGGEVPLVSLTPFERGHDTGRIELLCPAE